MSFFLPFSLLSEYSWLCYLCISLFLCPASLPVVVVVVIVIIVVVVVLVAAVAGIIAVMTNENS